MQLRNQTDSPYCQVRLGNQVEWKDRYPVFVHSTNPLPTSAQACFVVELVLTTGHLELGLCLLGQETAAPSRSLLHFSTELGLIHEPFDFNGAPAPCVPGDIITCGVFFGPIKTFAFVARNGEFLRPLYLPFPHDLTEPIFVFVSNTSAEASVSCNLAGPFRKDWPAELRRVEQEEVLLELQKLPPHSVGLRNEICDALCRDFLLHHGYVDTLARFVQGEVFCYMLYVLLPSQLNANNVHVF
jgi:hypothetical protein